MSDNQTPDGRPNWIDGTANQNFRATLRGVDEGHYTWRQDDGSFEVVSHDQPGVRYTIFYRAIGMERRVQFSCDCIGGQHFRMCKHAGLVGMRLEREGLATWSTGHWNATEKAVELASQAAAKIPAPADPFEGLEERW